jgi:hypothetical protein
MIRNRGYGFSREVLRQTGRSISALKSNHLCGFYAQA